MSTETHPSDEHLERYVLRQLSAGQETIVEEHYLICTFCQNRITQLDTPGFFEFVQALRSFKVDAAELSCMASSTRTALELVPVRVSQPAPVNRGWRAAVAAAAIMLCTVAGLRLMLRHPDALLARLSSPAGILATDTAALKPSAARVPEAKASRLASQRVGFRSRKYIRPISRVQFAAYRIFHPPTAIRSIIAPPVLDVDLQITAIADIDEPLQFDVSPEILQAPRRSSWRKLFAAIIKPFRCMLSQAERFDGSMAGQ